MSVLDKLMDKLSAMDENSLRAYALRLFKEKNFVNDIFNTLSEGVIVIDKQLKMTHYNNAAVELLGLPNDIKDVRISQILQSIDWKSLISSDLNEWEKISRQEIEIFYPSRKILSFYLIPHVDAEFATIILDDITELRKKRLSELETEKVNVISLLAASVAHEIGNPLNSISLHLQLISRELEDDSFDKNELLDLVNIAKDEVTRLDSIISQFLTAVRPTKTDKKLIDIKDLLIESLKFMKDEISNRAVNIKCDWPDVLPQIEGDRNQLKQVFFNILKNAIQAMPEGGDLDIYCSYDDDFSEIKFSDSGEGIDIDKLNKMFRSYYTTKAKGTGLGLMIVERIIREHNAEFAINSSLGEGTDFVIRFPRHDRKLRMLEEPQF